MVRFVSYIELVHKEILLKVFFKVLTGGTFVPVSPFASLEIENFTDEKPIPAMGLIMGEKDNASSSNPRYC